MGCDDRHPEASGLISSATVTDLFTIMGRRGKSAIATFYEGINIRFYGDAQITRQAHLFANDNIILYCVIQASWIDVIDVDISSVQK